MDWTFHVSHLSSLEIMLNETYQLEQICLLSDTILPL